MKSATVALVIRFDEKNPTLVETLTDDREISLLESAVGLHDPDPLGKVHEQRQRQAREDEEFGDYVEELLCQPFLRPEIQEHAVQWLKSKIRIEQYQRNESEAAKIISDYAYKIFQEDPRRTDFFLAGPTTQVRIRVFVIEEEAATSSQAA